VVPVSATTTAPDAGTPQDAPRTGLPVAWGLAARTGGRLVPPGPDVSPTDAAAEVARLRVGARTGEQHVRDLTGLGTGLPVPEAAVVDRPAWISSAVGGIAALTADVRLPTNGRAPSAVAAAAGRVTASAAGVQMGALLAFLSSRVLGQYDPFGGADGEGRLLLVAPNVTAARTALRADADDFALWVCLHEATHRLQFTAVPWLRDHFRDEVSTFASGLDPAATNALERLPDVVRALRSGGEVSIVEMLQGPEQRVVLDRLLALTTLLEGHAEHVMDEVGPEVVPSVATIRERFTQRRRGGGILDRALRALLGVEAKVKQYEQGRVFVDEVVRTVGMDGFNAVWTSPDTLPRRPEITDPQAWVARVHG
jgi:coenzyme F420 biosynthesis associated uncharacterized protein